VVGEEFGKSGGEVVELRLKVRNPLISDLPDNTVAVRTRYVAGKRYGVSFGVFHTLYFEEACSVLEEPAFDGGGRSA